MDRSKLLLLAMIAVLVPMAKSQTTLTIPSENTPCSPTPIYCYSVPVSSGDTFWVDISTYNNPVYSRFLSFHSGPYAGEYQINYSGPNDPSYHYTTVDVIVAGRKYTVPQSVSFTFSGQDVNGVMHTGGGIINLGNWYWRSGKYGGLGYYIVGGMVIFDN